MTAIDTWLIYEDEVEWLRKRLTERDWEQLGLMKANKRPRYPFLGELLYSDEFLFDYMRYLKYNIRPE